LHKYRHKIMKKFLLTTTAVLTILFAQAQVSYCDSLDISITSQTATDITLSSGLSVNAIPGIVNLDWTLYLSNGTVFAQDTAINPTFNINQWNMDSLSICLMALIDINGNVWTCQFCDTIIWNGNSWMLMSMSQPTAINELNSSNRELLKVVDILGRNANEDKNKPLFYIYNDGTVEKKIIIE
jgi:hypothetical protein